MIGLSLEMKDEMLAVFAGQSAMVGLFEGENEIGDPRYERLPVEFGPPQGDDVRYIENENEIRFDDMARDHVIDHWGIFDGAGQLMALYRLDKPRDVPAEDNFFFRPGRLTIGLP